MPYCSKFVLQYFIQIVSVTKFVSNSIKKRTNLFQFRIPTKKEEYKRTKKQKVQQPNIRPSIELRRMGGNKKLIYSPDNWMVFFDVHFFTKKYEGGKI